MRSSKIIITILVAILLSALFIIFLLKQKTSAPETNSVKYSISDIEKHSQPTDCWFAIEGKVYDVTKFIQSEDHPGGDQILLGCGKDATELYTNKVDLGIDHSASAKAMLAKYYIGELKN